ncbi:MAG: ATP-binding protein [Alphaproteobacteria bacterium]
MSQVLNSLVIANSLDTLRELEYVMVNNIEGYVLSFTHYRLEALGTMDREPDLIFIENDGRLKGEDVRKVIEMFPKKTYVVLDGNPERERSMFLRAGIDEVMSLTELQSNVGRHLLEKLVAWKHVADAETRAEQSEERFRGIIEHSSDIIMLLDSEATVLYCSPAFTRQTGHEIWTALGQNILDFVHEDGRAGIERGMRELMMMPASESKSMELQFLHKNGDWLTMEATGSNLLRDVTVQAVVLHLRNVTGQKQAEVELKLYRLHLEDMVARRTREAQEANRRADIVIASSPDALIAMDEKGVITFASRHYSLLYPKSAKIMAAGNHIMEAFDVVTAEVGIPKHDPRYTEMRQWWEKPKGAKEFKMPNGTWVRLQSRRIQETNGIVISTTNITDYKRQQALLAAQSAELEASLAKEKSVVEQQKIFVSMVSHEFRTPLTIIDGNAQIIHSRGDTIGKEALQKRAVTIRTGVDRLVRLIDTILSAHALDVGKLVVNKEDSDLAKLIRDVCADQQDISPNHKIRVEIRGVPPVMQIDEKIIRQMLANLVSNAVKYSPRSNAVEIMAFREGSNIFIEVQDHGVGIPESEVQHVFSRYFRASTSTGIPGSGLGLTLVKQFVDMHDGTVNLRSKVGIGTVVTVSLPIRD